MIKARVTITFKAGVLDPQGAAIEGALHSLGFPETSDVRTGKVIDLTLALADRREAGERVRQMCERLLSNPVIETYRIEWPDEAAGPS